jgi:hypothetical protein
VFNGPRNELKTGVSRRAIEQRRRCRCAGRAKTVALRERTIGPQSMSAILCQRFRGRSTAKRWAQGPLLGLLNQSTHCKCQTSTVSPDCWEHSRHCRGGVNDANDDGMRRRAMMTDGRRRLQTHQHQKQTGSPKRRWTTRFNLWLAAVQRNRGTVRRYGDAPRHLRAPTTTESPPYPQAWIAESQPQ